MSKTQEFLDAWLAGQIRPAPVLDLVGIEAVEARDGRAVVAMEVTRRHHNAHGIVHGGIYCDLADVALGLAVATTVGDDETFASIDLHCTFLKAVKDGRLLASARVVRRGRSTAYAECEVRQADEVVAKVVSTCLIRVKSDEASRTSSGS